VVSLRALTRPYHAVLCTQHSHIQVDECGAPELLTGCKLVDLPSPDARITPPQLRAAVRGLGNEHAVQPHVLSVTQTTEYGTAYSVAQLTELCGVAHELGLRVHMDGARIANAAASLGVSLRAITRDVGVDVLSFGATKNGAINAEAVLVFDSTLATELPFLRKQSAQLASKMRFQSAQFLALAEGDLWLANARHANAMAKRLAAGLSGIPGVTVTQPVEANAVFAILPPVLTTALQERFHFYVWNETTGEVRLMASWATAAEDVDELVGAVRGEQ
jgi:threonine aldolase